MGGDNKTITVYIPHLSEESKHEWIHYLQITGS